MHYNFREHYEFANAVYSRGLSTRPLGNLENFFKPLADKGKPLRREHWTIHLALSLQLPSSITDPVPYLWRAWRILLLRHPTWEATLGQDQSSNNHAKPQPSYLVVLRTYGVGMALLGHNFMLALSATLRGGHDCPLEILVPNLERRPSVLLSLEDVTRSVSRLPHSEEGEEHPDLAVSADDLVGIFLRGVPSIGFRKPATRADSPPE
ncbi:hypothetical protein F5Y06DRAFT_299106 [Hypoxylon sp. FL0890]|nr:hypothetical protein F5Y06DRAFT_299106 [Hypoxylon sp. FL0890]